jgi:uncharacterized protein YkwD
MKTKILFLFIASLLTTGCQLQDTESNAYSSTKETIPVVRINLRKDVSNGLVCEWSAAHSIEEKYLALINYLRAQPINCGDVSGPTTCLTWNTNLYNAAQEHSNDMAQNNFVSTKGSFKADDITAYDLGLSSGSSPSQRAINSGFNGDNIREVITKSIATNQSVSDDDIINGVEKLLNSKNGCSILMNGYVDSVGMAQSTRQIDGKTNIFWTQLFGSQKH